MFASSQAFSGFAVADTEQARQFYGDTLGLQVSVVDEGTPAPRPRRRHTVLVYGKPDHTPATYTILNFPVPDVDAAVDALAAKGVDAPVRRVRAGRQGHRARQGSRHRLVHRSVGKHPVGPLVRGHTVSAMTREAIEAPVGTPTEDDFPRLTDPYRRELLAHCYRMLGSVHDAEDLVQETYLRAWRALPRLRGPVLAAHLALPDRHQRLPDRAGQPQGRRPLPTGLGAPSSDPADPLVEQGEVLWLEPVPDAMVGSDPSDPATVVTDAGEHPARADRRAAAPAAAPAGGAGPARRAAAARRPRSPRCSTRPSPRSTAACSGPGPSSRRPA